jgi:glutamine amidotransferase
MPDVAIIDYGVGNLRSVQKAFGASGHDAVVTGDPAVIAAAPRVVLPGVGAFGAAAQHLRASGLESVALDAARSGKPFLGICVGMQLLFDRSEEMGNHRGLGLMPGCVLRFDAANLGSAAHDVRVPQMGWNAICLPRPSPLFARIEAGTMVYFLHSFYCRPDDPTAIAAQTEFIAPYASAVHVGNLFGVQFHPEKSGEAGLRLLDNFARLAA